MNKKAKLKKFYIALGILLATLVIIKIISIFIIGIDTKKVITNKNCASGLLKVGTVGEKDLYTYCVEDIEFLKNDGNYVSEKQFLKGTRFESMFWDGGTKVYKGSNYYIIACAEPQGPTKYIISSLDTQQEAWKHCHISEEKDIDGDKQ